MEQNGSPAVACCARAMLCVHALAKSISFRRSIAVLRISESLGLTVSSDHDKGMGLGATMS
jgi:hypothetical protein